MRLLLLIIFSLIFGVSHAQVADSTKKKNPNILIKGKVKDLKTGANVPNALIIQKGVGGRFLNSDGTFRIWIKKQDTLLISSIGYHLEKFCFKDSVGKEFTIDVKISKLQRELAAAIIMPKRKLSEVHKDLEELRLELPSRPTGVDALSSPITAIYEKFSKLGKSKALVAEWEHQDKKEDLLKELFKLYVDQDVINLSPDEFDRFINFCNVSDGFLRQASEYELITFFQVRYKEYLALKND